LEGLHNFPEFYYSGYYELFSGRFTSTYDVDLTLRGPRLFFCKNPFKTADFAMFIQKKEKYFLENITIRSYNLLV